MKSDSLLVSQLVDALGAAKAVTAAAKAHESNLKDDLIELADSSRKTTKFTGTMFDATVTFGLKTVSKLNVEKLAIQLGMPLVQLQAMIDGCTDREVAEGVPTVKVTARKA